jgi:hypothetical protein
VVVVVLGVRPHRALEIRLRVPVGEGTYANEFCWQK